MCYNLCCNPLYDSTDLRDDLSNSYCCVLDVEDKDEDVQCCSFIRSSKDKAGSNIFGYIGEKENMKKSEYKETAAVRSIKRLLLFQFVIFGILGILLLVLPREVSFALLVSDDYAVESGYKQTHQDELENKNLEEELEKLDEDSKDKSMFLDAWESILNRISSDNPKESKRQKIIAAKHLREATRIEAERIASEKPPQLIVTSFTRFYGAACVGIAWISFKMQSYDVESLYGASDGMIMWYSSGILALILSAVDRAGGLESSIYMFIMLGYYMFMAGSWYNGKEKLQIVKSITKQKEQKKIIKNLKKQASNNVDETIQTNFNSIDLKTYEQAYNNKHNIANK